MAQGLLILALVLRNFSLVGFVVNKPMVHDCFTSSDSETLEGEVIFEGDRLEPLYDYIPQAHTITRDSLLYKCGWSPCLMASIT